MKNGFYDPFFDPVKYFSSIISWTEIIIKHPGHRTPDTIRSLFDTPFRDSVDKFQQLFLLPVLIKALEREVANISDPKIISEVNLWIPVLKDIDHKERIPTEEGKMPKGFTVYFFRPYKFEFILAYVNMLPNDEKISHLIKKRAEIKEQIAFLETNPEESINERLILKQDAKRCKIEIEKLTALNAVKKLEPFPETPPPAPTAVQEPEEAPKLNLPQLALLYIYQEEILTKVKACSIAVDKGYKTGEAFWIDYLRLEKGTSYRTQEKVSIKNINKVLPYLISNPAAYAWANKELDVAIKYRDDGFLIK